VDVPLSSSLQLTDCDDLITAVRRVAAALPAHRVAARREVKAEPLVQPELLSRP